MVLIFHARTDDFGCGRPLDCPVLLQERAKRSELRAKTLVAVSKYIHRGDEFAIRSPS
jgi:hypothetical protein